MKNVKTNEVNLIRSRALTVLFSMAISALLLLPLFSSAKDGGKYSKRGKVYLQPLNKDYKVNVKLIDLQDGDYTLTVESNDGVNVYYDAILKSPGEFSKVFDFSRLNDGEYTLKVKSNFEEIESRFLIANGKMEVLNEEVIAPEYKAVGQKARIKLTNTNNIDYSFRIISPVGDELFSSVDDKENINKIFDFSKVSSGKYQIIVSSDNSDFAFDFENQK